MKVNDSWHVNGMTVLVLSDDLPSRGWKNLLLDGTVVAPIPVMDMGNNVIAIKGKHDLRGREIELA